MTDTSSPPKGPWRLIETNERGTVFWPSNPSRRPRFERRLPSGAILVDDFHAGMVIVSKWYGNADLAALRAKGRELGNRAIIKRQQDGLPWFVFEFQELYSADDVLVSRELRLISEYSGKRLLREIELPVQPKR